MKVIMHPRPMKRHQQHVVEVQADAYVRLAGDEATLPHPGLHLVLTLPDGSFQRVIFPSESLAELAHLVRVARVGASHGR